MGEGVFQAASFRKKREAVAASSRAIAAVGHRACVVGCAGVSRCAVATSKRAQRIEDAVLEVEGVVRVQVWELPDRIEIGVAVSRADTATDVLRRVTEVTDALRSPDETWEVGLLTEAAGESA